MAAIGIDIGTYSAKISVFRNGKPEIIPNELGKGATASYVAFSDIEYIVGDAARDQVTINPANTVYDFKRLIGRKFSDPILQREKRRWPFQLVADHKDRPKVEVHFKGETKTFYPEELIAMLLMKLKENAEAYLSQIVTDVVLTVPVTFTYCQRQSLKDAAKLAGLNVLKLITDTTAAALTYGMVQKADKERKIMLFDLGAGFLNVSFVVINNSTYVVRATSGESHLGGEDFLLKACDYLATRFQKRFALDLHDSILAEAMLREKCEIAKQRISEKINAPILCDMLYKSHDFMDNISRDQFERLNDELFKATMGPPNQALITSQQTKKDVTDIILLGGSSKIPKIQTLLQQFFDGRQLYHFGADKKVEPEEVVVLGAAMYAAMLKRDTSDLIKDLDVTDATPLSLGIESPPTNMLFVIPHNTLIPAVKTKTISTTAAKQTEMEIKIFEGERLKALDNTYLDSIVLFKIRPAGKGVPKLEVTITYDENDIITVSAVEKGCDNLQTKTIVPNRSFTLAELEKMTANLNEAKNIGTKHVDGSAKQENQGKKQLENYCYDLQSAMTTIGKEIREVYGWINRNPTDKDAQFLQKKKELQEKVMQILQSTDSQPT